MNYFEQLLEKKMDIDLIYNQIILYKATMDELNILQEKLIHAASVEKENYELIEKLIK